MKNNKYVSGIIAILLSVTFTACGNVPTVSSTMESQSEGSSPATVSPWTAEPTAASLNDTSTFDLSLDLRPVPIAGIYQFAEGPATDVNGNVYFSDITAGIIYKWTSDGNVTAFLEGLNEPNGLMFDNRGYLIACEGGAGRVISIDPQGRITVLADQYNGVRFNEPNDLWIDVRGGIYFTDPAYQSSVVQDGEHVYYISPDRSQVARVISDMVRPNGIVGTADGFTLYVADHGAGQTFGYTINADGRLANKQLFLSTGSDGMTLDGAGNLYITTQSKVQVYDAAGNLLNEIPTQENPTNVTFAGADGQTLFITARTAVYSVAMSAGNLTSTASGFALTSPDLPADGRLPVEYTCDGSASTLALSWSGAPAGTVSYAVIMHHVTPDSAIKWYWVLYDIPADVTSLPKNTTGIGVLGTNSVNEQIGYEPPCSRGPGDKIYIYTVYALSDRPQLSMSASQVNRAVLLDAIKDITLASAEMSVVYARP